MNKKALQLVIGVGAAAIVSAAITQVATAQAVCTVAEGRNGRAIVKLHSDPGGDGAAYVYVNKVNTTYFSQKNRWFQAGGSYVNDVVRVYNSELEWLCSN